MHIIDGYITLGCLSRIIWHGTTHNEDTHSTDVSLSIGHPETARDFGAVTPTTLLALGPG